MSIPPVAATLGLLGLSIIADSLAMSKPLVSIAGYYDLHLFPENDHFDYRVSETHRASQAMHIISVILLSISFFMVLTAVIFSTRWSDRAQRDFTVVTTASVVGATATYITAIATLLKIALDYKHIGDDIPLPTPDGKLEIGGIMDIVGFFSTLSACILVLLATIRANREGYLRLI